MNVFLALEVFIDNLCDRAFLCVPDIWRVDDACIDDWFFVLWPGAGHFDLIIAINNECRI